MKVMLDTNILISAFVFKSKIMNELIYVLSTKHEIFICSYVVDELRNIVKNKFNVKADELEEFFEKFPFTLVYSPSNVNKKKFKIRDENDYIILYTAIIEEIDVLITGDKDFFAVDIEKPEIITAKDFLEKYS